MNKPASSPEVQEEVAHRVRRTLAFKVMRDLHKAADEMQRDDQQRPRLLLRLLLIIVVIAILGAVLLRVF